MVFGLSAVTAGGFGAYLVLSACSPSPVDVSYGNPNTLDRKNIPGEGGAEPLLCGGDGGGVSAKGADGGCGVSFTTDIYPYMKNDGPWQCTTAACHGGGSQPAIDGTSADKCYQSLKAITVVGLPYLPSGGAKPDGAAASSSITCNLQGSCGSKMPKAPGKDPTTDELCKIDAWLACGAPLN